MSYIKLEELSISELEKGIEKALENSEDMFKEGEILYKNECFQRAYTLYQLAIEEIGKSKLLFSLIIDQLLGKEVNFKEINKDFTHHQTKSKSSVYFEVAALLIIHSGGEDSAEKRKAKFLDSFGKLQEEIQFINGLNNNKNNSLYVGIADNKFVSPKEIITKEMATELRTNTLVRLETSKAILKTMLTDRDKIVNKLKNLQDNNEDNIDDKFFESFFKD
jgi:AbiV family abortive infection protein